MEPTQENQRAARLFLFYGENSFTLKNELQHWITEFEKKYGDLNINILEGETLAANEIQSALESAPFLSEKRLVVIKNFLSQGDGKQQEKLCDALTKVADSTVAVFFEENPPDKRTKLFRTLKETGQLKEFELLTPYQLLEWINTQAIKRNVRLSPKCAQKLLEHTGPGMWFLDNELLKLSAYCKNRAATETDIETLAAPNLTTSIFKMTDALSEKNEKKAIDLFHILVENGESIRTIFAMLVRHFRILLLVSNLKTKNLKPSELYQQMKKYDAQIHPYVVSLATKQVKQFSIEQLKKIYEALAKLDLDMKMGDIQETENDKRSSMLAIEQFMVQTSKK